MLSRLYINNFGLIDEITRTFESGLTTITGETGAGKSMIIGALGFILGDRVDVKVLKDSSKKCILEAEFNLDNNLKNFFTENDLDWYDTLTIRREINTNGRSRAFVNDSPVKLDLLKKLNSVLIDIHTQEHTLKINSAEYQLYMLDLYANTEKSLILYRNIFSTYNRISVELKEFEEQINKDKKEFDFLTFQYKELESANIEIGEIDALEQKREVLANSESIKQSIEKASYLINDSDNNIGDSLQLLSSDFRKLVNISDWLNDYHDRLEKVYQEVKDLGYEFSSRGEEMEIVEGELEEVDQRLAVYYRLENKYHVKGDSDLNELFNTISEKIQKVNNYDIELSDKRKAVEIAYKNVIIAGEELNKLRKKSTSKFEKQIESNLKTLGISYPKVEFIFSKLESPEIYGLYDIELLFSSNPDSKPDRIESVASGGEKSRLMLVMKSILGSKLEIRSIVFDEIDTGISGEVAFRTGELIEKLGHDTQVISITHLSQVASKGNNHFKVKKIVKSGKTKISISKLNREERIVELAEMISGKKITESARKTAIEMLN